MSEIWEHQEESTKSIRLVEASKSQRLANFIIDMIASTILMGILILFMGFVFEFYGIAFFDSIEHMNRWLDSLISLLSRAMYYLVIEMALNGRSIGKMITGTRAVTESGDIPDFNSFVTRSFSRIVPFEPFSFLGEGTGWHDRWSDTIVIDVQKSVLPEDLFTDEYEY